MKTSDNSVTGDPVLDLGGDGRLHNLTQQVNRGSNAAG